GVIYGPPRIARQNRLVKQKGLLPYIRPWGEALNASGPDGIRAYRSHQVFGFVLSPRPQQTY
ncbi:hypothetical protein, partial [Vibrio genomosp. F10]|uniref:hypothetical protein n=1 Tax=Vibrio genomosp. F10 TaxID=723171 RepID=UPI001969AAB8